MKLALSIAAALLPAASLQLSELTWTVEPSPLVVFDWIELPKPSSGKTVWQALSRPEVASLAWKRLVTSWLYQPAPFGLVVACRSVSDGATVSILTVSDLSVLLLALSVAWQSIWWMPSLETLVVQLPETPATRVSAVEVLSVQLGEPAASPEPASAEVIVTVTGELLFQPAPLALWLTERLGAIESCSVCVVVASGLAGAASTLSATSVARV